MWWLKLQMFTRTRETFPSIVFIVASLEKGCWKGRVVMSRKTPVSADVGNSAGYWGVRGSGLGWGREGAELTPACLLAGPMGHGN